MRYGGNAPASHCGGLGLVPGQSVTMCTDEIAFHIFRRVFRFSPISTRKTPTMIRTRFHLYRYISQEDEQTKPGDNRTKVTLFSHIEEHEEWKILLFPLHSIKSRASSLYLVSPTWIEHLKPVINNSSKKNSINSIKALFLVQTQHTEWASHLLLIKQRL